MKKQIETNFRVSEIADYIERGEATGKIVEEFTQRWGVTSRTVANYIAKAREVVADRGKSKQAIIQAVRKEAITTAENSKLIQDAEIEEVLSAIIRGEHELERTIIQNGQEKVIKYKPTHFDIIMAIDKLWKKRGAYPVEKKQVENQQVNIVYNLQNPEDIKYIENV